jgi:mRNA-degrading endonuclease RelE of RelBE toxin-antitoxin system
MFSYDISDILKKKLEKISKKDKILVLNFYKKLQEIINRDEKAINMYKNLKSLLNEYKRIHLTDNYILLFIVKKNHIVFIDIRHFDDVYKRNY